MRNPDFEQLTEKELAETIPCRGCGAPKGEPCFTVGLDGLRHPLNNFPAHLTRTKRAHRLQRMAAEENLTMTDDGLFETADIPTPTWTNVPVTALVITLYRGQIVECDGEEIHFTGTSRGAENGRPYVDVHGRNAAGRSESYRYACTDSIRVKARDPK